MKTRLITIVVAAALATGVLLVVTVPSAAQVGPIASGAFPLPVPIPASAVNGAGVATVSGIAVTSTDGLAVTNLSPATAGATVQMSPRFKWCGSAYNSVSTLSETDCMFAEVLPATAAGTTTQTWKLGSIINGGAATYPAQLTAAGLMTVGTPGGSSAQIGSNGGTGNVSILNASGVGIDFRSINAGTVNVSNNNGTGAQIKVDALPTVSACGAGSPAVTAGSTPWYGSVTIGTTSVATCSITFNGTAYPSTPHCSGAVETTTPANARVMGYSATTTVLTIVPSAAWADSSVVNWNCGSSK